jgi:hypothetical protein
MVLSDLERIKMTHWKLGGLLAAALTLSACGSIGGGEFDLADARNRTPQTVSTEGPPSSYTQQHWFNADRSCVYSRAQAPGYAPTWHVILNPEALYPDMAGKSSRKCPTMLEPGW